MSIEDTPATFDTIFRQNPLPMWFYDIRTLEFLAVNRAAVETYGYTEAEFLAMTIADIRPLKEQIRLRHYTATPRAAWVDAGIWEHRIKSGQLIWVKIVSHAFEYQGRAARLVSALDVTDQKRAETEIAEALDRAKRHTVQLQRVNRLAQRMYIGSSTDALLQQIVDEARLILGAHQAVMSFTVDQQWRQSINAVAYSDKYADYRDYNVPPDGSGIYRLVCETNQPMRLTQAQLESHPAWRNFGNEAFRHPPMNGWLAAPLIDREGRNIGLIQMSDKFEGEFDADDEAILVQIAHMASGILDNARLFTALQATENRISRLYHLSRQMAVMDDPMRVMQTAIDEACTLIGAPWGIFVFIPGSPDAPDTFAYAMHGLNPRTLELLADLKERGAVGNLVFHQQQSLRMNDVRTVELYNRSAIASIAAAHNLDIAAFLAVPVVTNTGRSLGGLFFSSPQAGAFAHAHQQLAEAVAAHAGITLEKLILQNDLEEYTATLESRVAERTAQLEQANSELEAFTYSVSHDLRAPLRAIDGFSQILLERYHEQLDESGVHYLERIRLGTERMSQLISDLLELSRVTRKDISRKRVNLSRLARSVEQDLQQSDPERTVQMEIEEDLTTHGDEQLLGIVVHNLLENAWKFTSKTSDPQIRFHASMHDDGRTVFCVTDNGAGFDMAYSDKLFGVFQRLHRAGEFPGTGVGLATVQRILHRHGGDIWAKAAPNQGASFWFTVEPPPGPAHEGPSTAQEN